MNSFEIWVVANQGAFFYICLTISAASACKSVCVFESENLASCISYWEFELQALGTHLQLTHQQKGQQMGEFCLLQDCSSEF